MNSPQDASCRTQTSDNEAGEDMERSDAERLDTRAADSYRRLETSVVRRLYRRVATAVGLGELGSQRLKAIYFAPGYWRLVFLPRVPLLDRLRLIREFLRVDWNVLHGHRPEEIAAVSRLLALHAQPGEAMVEAGCWRGGSTAKFSILCRRFGLKLRVYDSFEGVESLDVSVHPNEWKFGGQYACDEQAVKRTVEQFGRIEVCTFHKGWFSATFASPVPAPVRLAYIDCDLAKGTIEVLQGVLPSMVPGGIALSQDFHIAPVREALLDAKTWESLGVSPPDISICSVYMAQMSWR